MYLLLISTLSCILDSLGPDFIKYITTYTYARRKYDIELKNYLSSLRQEMIGVNMTDNFSKYAKLQRKCNKLEETLMKNASEQLASRLQVQLIVTNAFRILNGLFVAIMLYLYQSQPVVVLPQGILWPLQGVLSWPNGYEDSISLVIWLLISRLVISSIKKVVVP